MSENDASKRPVELIPSIMERWDERVRAEVPPAAAADEVILRDDLAQMLEVMSKS